MIKKVLLVLAVIFISIISIIIYGVYQFLNPFGELVDEEISHSYFYTKDKQGIVYSPMGNWFELGKTEMQVDMASFQVLGNYYAKDNNQAYIKAKVIHFDIDVPSFKVLNGDIPMDKNHVYVLKDYYASDTKNSFRILDDADPSSFVPLNHDFAKDDNFIFRNNEKVTEVEYQSFEIINSEFCKDRYGIYHYRYRKPLQKLDSINSLEVVSLTESCIRDDKNIYFYLDRSKGQVINKIMHIPFKNYNQISFFKDKAMIKVDHKIYYEGIFLEKADALSFEEIRSGYAKDNTHVFYLGEIIPNADPKTFRYDKIDYVFYDKDNIYEGGKATKKR